MEKLSALSSDAPRVNALKPTPEPVVQWDVLVVGGGATGLGVAVQAALQGQRVALLEAEAVAADVGVGMKPIALDCVAVAKRDRCVTVGVAAPELVPLPVPTPVVERLVCGDRLSVRAADLEPEPDDVAVRLRADLLPVPEDVGVGT